jgi:hypothetical protein
MIRAKNCWQISVLIGPRAQSGVIFNSARFECGLTISSMHGIRISFMKVAGVGFQFWALFGTKPPYLIRLWNRCRAQPK